MAHENKYDLIFSNPPFYEREILSSDYRRNVAHHQGGLDLKTLFPLVAGSLNDKGQFWLLLPFKREREILQILSLQNMFVNSIFFMRQTVDHDYFRMIIHGAKSDLQNNPMTQDLAIKDHAGNYTAEFISLLKDYYLHL
jgi:tRNA1Val (adenine37-N6)-methyltransferase